ncbi:MAG: response regulator [Chitinophagaceae bacterium]
MDINILIVDDKPENILPLRKLLSGHEYNVDAAESGEDALKKILKKSYALIILDVQMPGMDGFEVAEAISGYSKARDIPVIFLSAVNTEKRFIAKGYNSGAIDYLTKPVDPDILLLKVQNFCRLYKQTRELNEMHRALKEEMEIRKEAQNEATEKLLQLRSTIESMPQIAFTLTKEGAIEFVNDQWKIYAPNEHNFPSLHPDDEPGGWFEAVQKGIPYSRELRLRHPVSNEYRYHLLRMLPVVHEHSIKNWVGTFTDIHEQKQANEILEVKIKERTKELQQTNIALEESNKELEQFAYVTSHDLKEPLRKIQVFASLIRERISTGRADEVVSYADRVAGSSRRLSNLINDLLRYSRLSVPDDFYKTDMNGLINSIIEDLELSIKETKTEIRIGQIPELEVIPRQMQQAFQNLISNAVKFGSGNKQPVIEIHSELVAEKNFSAKAMATGPYCRITVSDNGIGFDQKYAEKIFVIFQRLNTYDKYEGTGIGLAIVRKIIERHNGIIMAKSIEGEGATFTIILPVKQSN